MLILGDFNDEPSDASVVGHLQAPSELDRGVGATNQITRFETEVATYRGDDTWLYNACWKFLAPENLGTFFIESTASGEHFANRYQVLDNLVASRGLLLPGGVTLDPATVDIYRAASVAAPPAVSARSTRRPRRAPPTTSPSPPSRPTSADAWDPTTRTPREAGRPLRGWWRRWRIASSRLTLYGWMGVLG